MSIPRLAIHRPVTMFMISFVVILLGAISLTRLPVDLMPESEFPSITVRVGYSGVGPLEMEELVTRPLEQAVSAIAGLEQVNATSSEGNSNVRLQFAWGTDLAEAADEVRTRVDRVRGRMPEDADPPTVQKFDSNSMPIMGIGVEGNYDPVTLRELAQNDLSPRLERVDGVAAVTIDGGLRRQIRIDLSREKITALNLPVDRISQVLRSENQNIPLGEIEDADRRFLLRSPGQFTSVDDIRNLIIMTRGNVPVYLKDIAEVRDTTEDRRSVTRINSREAVRMRVTKQSGKNTVQVADAVRAELARINAEGQVTLSVIDDQSKFINRSINSVKEHAAIGGMLVVLIIFLFLRNIRSTLIICTSIPVSVIGTFALLYFGGYTLNTLTFGGLALGIGMIVDAAIVVLENTYRHLEMGKDRITAAIDGSEEVWSAILASTLTHIAVFVPMLFLTGVASITFGQLAAVVSFSLAMSLFVAVTIVPVLCSRYLQPPDHGEKRKGLTGAVYRASDRLLNKVDEVYARSLHTALAHRPTVFATGVALFVLAIYLIPYIPVELQPTADEGQVTVDAELAVGTRVERTEDVLLRLEEQIKERVPEMVMMVTSASGGGGMGGMGGGGHRGSINLYLVPKDERQRSSEEIAMTLRRELAGIPGVIVRARQSGGQQMRGMPGGNQGGDGSRFSVEIRGHDLETSKRLAMDVKTLLDSTPGIADSRVGREEGRPEIALRVDRDKAATMGLTVTGVANTIRTNLAGTQAAMFREAGNEFPIIVRLREEDRNEIASVGDVLLSTPQGQVVPAKNVMVLGREQGPVQIERKNQERIQRVNAEVETNLSEAVAAVQARLPELNVPTGFSVGFGNEVEEQQKSFRELQLVLILAILLVYTVMASQYESLKDPFIIMFSIPLAAIGVVLALLLTQTAFSMQAYIGIIMLAGIVVSNAILLVDYANTLRHRDGMDVRQAIEVAGRHRLRPILMTSVCTILGLVPMSLGIGEGSELQVPLARVVIGGLLTSTMITLVFVPALYTVFEEGWRGLFKKGPAAPATPPAAPAH